MSSFCMKSFERVYQSDQFEAYGKRTAFQVQKKTLATMCRRKRHVLSLGQHSPLPESGGPIWGPRFGVVGQSSDMYLQESLKSVEYME